MPSRSVLHRAWSAFALTVLLLTVLLPITILSAVPPTGEQETPEQPHNCRLWGIVSEHAPSAAIEAQLITLPNSLENLSPSNTDGWGIAYYPDGSADPVSYRGYPPAYSDPNYDDAVAVTAAANPRIAVAHVRNASSGLIPASGDPHPFEKIKDGKHWLMAHNGSIDKDILIDLIRPDYLAANPPEYGTSYSQWIDSELYFLFMLQTMEDFNWQVKPALGYVIRRLQEEIPNDGERINFYLTDGTTLWAYREGSSTHTLYYYYSNGSTPYSAVASQYPDATQGDWVEMTDGQIVTLRQTGAPVLEEISDYFGETLVHDNNFDMNETDADLRGAGYWYESRGDDPSLLTLNTDDIGGNASKKAAFAASAAGNAYLSQELDGTTSSGVSLRWDVYVDNIADGDDRDRGALMMAGQDLDAANGPNSNSNERFVFLSCWVPGGGDSGPMTLIAREPGDGYADSNDWLTVATDLELDRWYTIQVDCDFTTDTYDVYINGALAYAGVQGFTPMDEVTHISFAQWNDGVGAFLIDNVYEGTPLVTRTLTIAASPGIGGTTEPEAGVHHYGDGEVVAITATPADGYQFDYWTGDVAAAGDPTTTVAMDEDQTVTAHFSLLPVVLVSDNYFDDAVSSEDLRADGAGQDWYESRNDDQSLLTLNTDDIDGNATPKAAFQASETGNVYMSHPFGEPQTGVFSIQWDIYVDEILDGSGTDYSAWMMIGDDADGQRGPNSTSNDRFVFLAFQKDGGGTDGTMDLVAREPGAAWEDFTVIAAGLNLDQWYTIGVTCDVVANTYDIYVDGDLVYNNLAAYMNKTALTHISFAQWNDEPGAFYVDNVLEGFVLDIAANPSAGGSAVRRPAATCMPAKPWLTSRPFPLRVMSSRTGTAS